MGTNRRDIDEKRKDNKVKRNNKEILETKYGNRYLIKSK